MVAEAVRIFQQNLRNNPQAIEYLKARGMTDAAIDFFQIGYADGKLREHFKARGISNADMRDSKLFFEVNDPFASEPFVDFFRNRIMFPTVIMGNVLFLSGRDFSGKADRKYLNLPVPNNNLINGEILMKNPPYVVLTEGYMDCYSLVLNKFPSVGIAGCNRRKKAQLEKIAKIPKIFIMFDYDKNGSGQKGATKTAYNLCRLGHKDVHVVSLPSLNEDKMDVNQLYVSHKPKFAELIRMMLEQCKQPFHETGFYDAMEKDELSKEIIINDMTAEESMQIYAKYLPLTLVGNKLFRCLCPFHQEKTASFTVYPDNGASICYGCNASFENGKQFEEQLKLVRGARMNG